MSTSVFHLFHLFRNGTITFLSCAILWHKLAISLPATKYLYISSICKRDGSHNGGAKEKDIERMEDVFNFMLFGPLYYIQQSLNKEDAPIEEW